jgi:hypothetical protein
MRTRFPTYCARLRLPLLWAAGALLLGSLLGGPAWTGPAGLVLLAAGMALYFRVGTVRRPPVEVDAPMTGRWLAVNSPADKVPSHGLHAYGQTYAIDLVHEPTEGSRPEFGAGPAFRPPEDFPAFGRPVLAPAEGTVVRAHGRERDHRSRSSWPSLLYLFAEGSLRELTGLAGSSATTWCSTSAAACTPCSPTSGAARCGRPRASGSRPASRSPSAGTRATPPSRTSTSS